MRNIPLKRNADSWDTLIYYLGLELKSISTKLTIITEKRELGLIKRTNISKSTVIVRQLKKTWLNSVEW